MHDTHAAALDESNAPTAGRGQRRWSDARTLSAEILETNLKLADLARKCEDPRSKLDPTSAALEACRLLRGVPGGQPDTVAYNCVLKVLSKISPARLPPMAPAPAPAAPADAQVRFIDFTDSEDRSDMASTTAAEWAKTLLEEMKVVHAQQYGANAAWYSQLKHPTDSSSALFDVDGIDDDDGDSSLGGSKVGPPRVYVKPNVRSYSTVMDAFARHGTSESCDACQELLHELEQRYRETGDVAYRPNIIAYNTCLSALAKARRTQECWDLFLSMPVERDIISVNVLLHALARSGWTDAGERAESILRNFTTSQATGESIGDGTSVKLKNNGRTYATCMDAWARCGRPDKAQELLDELLLLFDASSDEAYRPNCVPFATVIFAYSVSKDRNKAKHAFRVFQRMKERKVVPNSVVLNNLLNCFATRPHPETVEMVETLYRHILEKHGGLMDHFTFGIVLKAVSTCRVFWKDAEFAPGVFRECCRRGFVSAVVLRQLRQAVPVDTYRELLEGSDHVDVNRIPLEWKRHVVERGIPSVSRRRRS
jgi:pentatricopeptide repeat protein